MEMTPICWFTITIKKFGKDEKLPNLSSAKYYKRYLKKGD